MKQLITNINVEMMVEILDIEIDFFVLDRPRALTFEIHHYFYLFPLLHSHTLIFFIQFWIMRLLVKTYSLRWHLHVNLQ